MRYSVVKVRFANVVCTVESTLRERRCQVLISGETIRFIRKRRNLTQQGLRETKKEPPTFRQGAME